MADFATVGGCLGANLDASQGCSIATQSTEVVSLRQIGLKKMESASELEETRFMIPKAAVIDKAIKGFVADDQGNSRFEEQNFSLSFGPIVRTKPLRLIL